MPESKLSSRKKDHIQLCMSNDVENKVKSSGFENYEFVHAAHTEIDLDEITLSTRLFKKRISLPFIISCMTGGTASSEKINEKLALVAKHLNIPIGVGSQRQALENSEHHSTYRVIREKAGSVPVLGNIGAAQIAKSINLLDEIKLLIDLIEADAMVIHLNPLQELLQKEGEPEFKGFRKNLAKICSKISTPIIVKEVGSGISKTAAKALLEAGVSGIDVAGAGGTSWAKVEMMRNNFHEPFLEEWGLPTAYCVKTVNELKKKQKFTLISSGGINDGEKIAKSIALGADLTASARPIIQELQKNDIEGVVNLIENWFSTVKKIMYLTGCDKIKDLQKVDLLRKAELY